MEIMWPSLIFAAVVCAFYAGLFHLMTRQGAAYVLVYWMAALLGFGLGQLASVFYTQRPFMVGPIHFVEGTIGAWIVMSVVSWLKT
ncbi:MAG: hypothetical protein GXP41_06565 [Chloroflexi bacterium]|nr:hypothetical protein [Chloroflexota bacterium]